MISLLFTAILSAAGAAENIDKLFEKAAALEKDGDCTGAHDVYTDITGLTASLPVADKKRIDAQVKSRQARNKQCVEACTISDKDKKMFEQVKQSQEEGELKRVAEMCKVLMHGKNAKCPAFAEIRSFCPVLGENGDPCGVSAETAAELEKLKADVAALEKRSKNAAWAAVQPDKPKGVDQVASANREIDATYERLFDLRERYFACDKVYGGLKMEAGTLNKSRGQLRTALAKGYNLKLKQLSDDLDALQKSKDEVDQKVEKLTAFTNDVALDVMSLAQTESVRSSVKVEGVTQNNAEQLAKVLQGDRQAMEAMIKSNPDHFKDDSATTLQRKKDSLERLDQLLTKLGDSGYGERLGFKTAQQEVKATLALVNSVLPKEGEAHASSFPVLPVAIGGGALLLIGLFVLLKKKGGDSAPTTSLSLSSRPRPGAAKAAASPTAQRTPAPAAAAAPAAKGGAPRKGMLGLSANKGAAAKPVAPVAKPVAPPPPPMSSENTEPSSSELLAAQQAQAAAAREAEERAATERAAREAQDRAEREAATKAAQEQMAARKAADEAKAAADAAKTAEAAKTADASKTPKAPPPPPAKPAQQRPGIKLLSAPVSAGKH